MNLTLRNHWTRMGSSALAVLLLALPRLAFADEAEDAGLEAGDAEAGAPETGGGDAAALEAGSGPSDAGLGTSCTDGLNAGDLLACAGKAAGDPCTLASGPSGSCATLRCGTAGGAPLLACVVGSTGIPSRDAGSSGGPGVIVGGDVGGGGCTVQPFSASFRAASACSACVLAVLAGIAARRRKR